MTQTGQTPIRPATYAARRRAIGRHLDPQRRHTPEALNRWIDDKLRKDIAALDAEADARRARGDKRGAARIYDQIGDLEDLLTPPHVRRAG
jgi:hypothetical protein